MRADRLPLLTGLIDQAALILERLRLEAEVRDVDAVRTRDRLRAALLSSVSHDLRTPLTAVMAAAAQLRQGATDLIATIEGRPHGSTASSPICSTWRGSRRGR